MTVSAGDLGGRWWKAAFLLVAIAVCAVRSKEAQVDLHHDDTDTLSRSEEPIYDKDTFVPEKSPAQGINIRRVVGNPENPDDPFSLIETSSLFDPYFPSMRSLYTGMTPYFFNLPSNPRSQIFSGSPITLSSFRPGIQYPYTAYPISSVQSILTYPQTTMTTTVLANRDPVSETDREKPHLEVVVDYSSVFNKSLIPPSSEVEYTVDCGMQNSDFPFAKMTKDPIEDEDDDSGRIVGGATTQPGEFPWQVSIQQKSRWGSTHICGGAILSEDIVVTAGHCVDGLRPSSIRVVAGAHNLFVYQGKEQVRGVKAFRGRGYDKSNYGKDIALLVVDKPFKFDPKHVAPVCLPRSDFVYDGKDGIITGWGRLSENGRMPSELQVVTIPIIGLDKCRKSYDRVGYGKFVNNCQICTGTALGGLDSCQGDSGGPLTCVRSDGRHYLCGIVSWGLGCARPDFPGVYTSTPCYSDWITGEIRKYNSSHRLYG